MDKDRRKELKEAYKQVKIYMGVYQITNKTNEKIYIDSCPNLKNKWLTLQGQLDMGMFANFQLQKDWKELGADAFTYEVLEKKDASEVNDRRWELKQMKKPWLEKLQPYGNRGYNKRPTE
ncbi:GIY-YIG nuclease family protein [Neobacillus vireti]|uniref:LuxR family transcriptional regulator n=1 Tax=Neobacillus vireti LMG 21834 TaxID=1131730 RepID=A0AB94IRN5_9BACI|nr:GIY-YIG nuclease family protein [Neobacillus vireti]ETI69751.1 LuxR family transcriptional regulator [Neobacillus vireti LMG 21834]KLT17885.1 LuxR family transcriptional regulator [Neobacillus vireti]